MNPHQTEYCVLYGPRLICTDPEFLYRQFAVMMYPTSYNGTLLPVIESHRA